MRCFNLRVNRLSAEFKGTMPVGGFGFGEIVRLGEIIRHEGVLYFCLCVEEASSSNGKAVSLTSLMM